MKEIGKKIFTILLISSINLGTINALKKQEFDQKQKEVTFTKIYQQYKFRKQNRREQDCSCLLLFVPITVFYWWLKSALENEEKQNS